MREEREFKILMPRKEIVLNERIKKKTDLKNEYGRDKKNDSIKRNLSRERSDSQEFYQNSHLENILFLQILNFGRKTSLRGIVLKKNLFHLQSVFMRCSFLKIFVFLLSLILSVRIDCIFKQEVI